MEMKQQTADAPQVKSAPRSRRRKLIQRPAVWGGIALTLGSVGLANMVTANAAVEPTKRHVVIQFSNVTFLNIDAKARVEKKDPAKGESKDIDGGAEQKITIPRGNGKAEELGFDVPEGSSQVMKVSEHGGTDASGGISLPAKGDFTACATIAAEASSVNPNPNNTYIQLRSGSC